MQTTCADNLFALSLSLLFFSIQLKSCSHKSQGLASSGFPNLTSNLLCINRGWPYGEFINISARTLNRRLNEHVREQQTKITQSIHRQEAKGHQQGVSGR